MGSRTYSFDKFMQLADGAAATTGNGIGQVASANKILDLGGAQTRTDLSIVGGMARLDGVVVIDVSAITVANTDNLYRLTLMGSNNSDGSKPVVLGEMSLGNFTLIPNGSTGSAGTGAGSTSVIGRYELLFSTEQGDINYRYIYLYNTVAGTSKSITYTAFAAVLPII